jgi:hypothetical protein
MIPTLKNLFLSGKNMTQKKVSHSKIFLFPLSLAVIFFASFIIILSPVGKKNIIKITQPSIEWKTITLKGCSTENPKFMYEIEIPKVWNYTSLENNQYRTNYRLTNNDSFIEISCDTVGVGSAVCSDDKVDNPFKILNAIQNGCYWEATPSGTPYGAEYHLKNQFGTFLFTAKGVDKQLLDSILSTFKYTK